jgi:predicted TIM-barrel fold metal-dependent hydrolase
MSISSPTIIDTDTHVIDPPDIWVDRMSSDRWGDEIPHVAFSADMNREMWFVGDEAMGPAWSSAMRGGVPGMHAGPERLTDVHPSCYDAAARVEGMDANGIAIEVLYPNLGLTGDVVPGRSRELALEIIRVRNDWQLDWVSAAPHRFIPLACVPYWDVEAAVAEVERCAQAGHKGVIMTAAPELHGQPVFGDPHWDRLWAAIQEHNLPVSFHIATGDPMANFSPERMLLEGAATSMARGSCLTFVDNCKFMINLMFSGVLPKYPGLKFVTVESGISWIPFALDSADYMFTKARGWEEHPEFKMLPSEYFRRQVWANYWFEHIEDYHIERIGADRILFETDFPHPCCLTGDEIGRTLDTTLQNQPAEVRERILWRNAAELFNCEDLLRDAGD